MDNEAMRRFILNALNGQIDDLRRSLYRTRRDLIALAGLLNSKGITIEEAEWQEAARTIEAAHQVDLLFDPRVQRGEELFRRILEGEDVEKEVNDWMRQIEEGRG